MPYMDSEDNHEAWIPPPIAYVPGDASAAMQAGWMEASAAGHGGQEVLASEPKVRRADDLLLPVPFALRLSVVISCFSVFRATQAELVIMFFTVLLCWE